MISRYTVHVDGRHDPIAVRDRLHGCLSEWEVVADVHVTAGDGRYTVHVDWDIDHPDWAEECWPMHAGGQLGRAVESVDVTAEVVCHDQPVPVVLEVDTTPPRPPYELDRPGNRPEGHAEGLLAADPYSPTHGGTQATQDALSSSALERLILAAADADGPWTLHGPDPEWTIRDATVWVRRHGPGLITGLAHTTCAEQHKGGQP